jgi:hypothetical protein
MSPIKHETSNNNNTQSSLLTAILFSLNELLPQYCNHLFTAADMGPSNGAAKAIEVLEEGSAKLCKRSPSKRENPMSRSLVSAQTHSPTFSPSQFLKQLSTGSRSPNKHHFLTPAPTRRSLQESSGSGPRSAPSSPSYFNQGMSRTTLTEWERFVSPFLMLAAAEVLYGRMEHVIDPASQHEFEAKHRNEGKSNDGDIAPSHLSFRFPIFDCFTSNNTTRKAGPISVEPSSSVRKSPIVSFDFAAWHESPARKGSSSTGSDPKRGSKRLGE